MRKSIFYLFCISIITFFPACENWLDVNEDPNRVTEASLNSLLPPVIEGLSRAHYELAFTTSQANQQIGSYFGYFEQFTIENAWSTLYLRVLGNADQLYNQATDEGASHYRGVARVLQAAGLGLATDVYEDAPFTEAFRGSDNFQPAYDSQELLYTRIQELLDEAILLLNQEESTLSPGNDDLIYDGDLDKWIKAAHTLKARYALHLSNKGGSFAQDALESIEDGFQSNSDDFQLVYNSVVRNPWHTNVALAINTGNFTVAPSSYLIDLMNGNIYGYDDPRLPFIADKGANDEYIGINSYDSDAPGNTVDFSETTWHSTATAPILMSTYAEARFIEAEAAFLAGQSARAYDAFLAGIEASMTKLGVDQGEIDAYLNLPEIAVGAGNLSLDMIMKEKFIALYLNPESWTDIRRYNYDDEVFNAFVIPDQTMWNGPPQRSLYPLSELNRNAVEVQKVSKDFSQPMWRDQN